MPRHHPGSLAKLKSMPRHHPGSLAKLKSMFRHHLRAYVHWKPMCGDASEAWLSSNRCLDITFELTFAQTAAARSACERKRLVWTVARCRTESPLTECAQKRWTSFSFGVLGGPWRLRRPSLCS